jgi:hypothetical protein
LPDPAVSPKEPTSPSTTSASASSPNATDSTPPAPKEKPRVDPAKVKAILDARAARHNQGATPSPDPKASSPASGRPGADGASPSSSTPTADAASADGASPAKPADGDPDLALRLARIAKSEDQARATIKEAASVKTELVEYRAWKEGRAKDPIAAATAGLTEEQEDKVYWHLNDKILAKGGKEADPAESARKAAREEIERDRKERAEAEGKTRDESYEQAKVWYVTEVAKVFEASPKTWPAVAARGVSPGDIHTYSQGYWTEHGTAPDAAAVLGHFQKLYETEIEAAGYTRQKVEAQPGGEGPRGTTTVTNEWSAGAGPASNGSGHSRRESSEEIKRKHFKS